MNGEILKVDFMCRIIPHQNDAFWVSKAGEYMAYEFKKPVDLCAIELIPLQNFKSYQFGVWWIEASEDGKEWKRLAQLSSLQLKLRQRWQNCNKYKFYRAIMQEKESREVWSYQAIRWYAENYDGVDHAMRSFLLLPLYRGLQSNDSSTNQGSIPLP